MGLSAQQARLLTITARKADCEYQSMNLSHQKLSISRELEDISNEYQNSLNQTKLIYDFYGTGDTSEQLKYNTLMSPSALNDYIPITITNQAGRVVLDKQLAIAAKAAGIPQEGLGCVPSSAVREQFYLGLASAGLITEDKAKQYAASSYNQALGVGASSTESTYTTVPGDLDDLKKLLINTNISVNPSLTCGNNGTGIVNSATGASVVGGDGNATISISQLLSDDPNDQVVWYAISENGRHFTNNQAMEMADKMTGPGGFIEQIYNGFASVLETGDPRSTAALNYAKMKTEEIFAYSTSDIGESQEGHDNDNGCWSLVVNNGNRPKHQQEEDAKNNIVSTAGNIIGIAGNSYWKGGKKGGRYNAAAGINLNNIAKVFLSYFAEYMEGLPTEKDKKGEYYGEKGWKQNSNLVTSNTNYVYYFKGTTVNSETDNQYVNFYDTLLNQLCTSGWTENQQITDPEYLQEMLQNGMMFITKLRDDGYYYQGNYATDSYIKEVTDETAIAKAEAKYNTMKTKLNNKEQTIDLKMKNLDTEISSLTTEYDTVKNTISKNIEKSFKRYNA